MLSIDVLKIVIASTSLIAVDLLIRNKFKCSLNVMGMYRLIVITSAIQGTMKCMKRKGIEVVIYEATFDGEKFFNSKVIKDLNEFKGYSDVIVANRLAADISDVPGKVYTRDLLGND